MAPTENNFKTLLSLYRRAMSPAQRKRTQKIKPRAMVYPIGIERAYASDITNKNKALVRKSWELLIPFLTRWSPVKSDSADTELDSIMKQLDDFIDVNYGSTFIVADLGQLVRGFAEKILGKNTNFFESQIAIVAGTPITVDQPWWPEVRSLWEQENYRLIKGLGEEYVRKLNSTVITGVQQGWSFNKLTDEITKLSDQMVGWRARLTARDQIGKLNGAITKAQYQSIGMETYYWMTSHDERVRGNPSGKFPKAIPSHWIMQDVLCSWKNAAVYYDFSTKSWVQKTGKMEPSHPGFAIACRCLAAPSWERYLKDIDEGSMI